MLWLQLMYKDAFPVRALVIPHTSNLNLSQYVSRSGLCVFVLNGLAYTNKDLVDMETKGSTSTVGDRPSQVRPNSYIARASLINLVA